MRSIAHKTLAAHISKLSDDSPTNKLYYKHRESKNMHEHCTTSISWYSPNLRTMNHIPFYARHRLQWTEFRIHKFLYILHARNNKSIKFHKFIHLYTSNCHKFWLKIKVKIYGSGLCIFEYQERFMYVFMLEILNHQNKLT